MENFKIHTISKTGVMRFYSKLDYDFIENGIQADFYDHPNASGITFEQDKHIFLMYHFHTSTRTPEDLEMMCCWLVETMKTKYASTLLYVDSI